MTQVIDKKAADPVIVDLSNRYANWHYEYQKQIEETELMRKRVGRALDRELYKIVGLKPKDKVIYKGDKYVVDDVFITYLAEKEEARADVYVTIHPPRDSHCTIVCLSEEEIIKL